METRELIDYCAEQIPDIDDTYEDSNRMAAEQSLRKMAEIVLDNLTKPEPAAENKDEATKQDGVV